MKHLKEHIINRTAFIALTIVYIILYISMCVISPILQGITSMKASTSEIWVLVSFFLIEFIVWQTDLKAQKLNRTFLALYGLNLVLTVLSIGIIDLILNKTLDIIVMIIAALLIIIALALFMTYIIQKINGVSNDYDSYRDILTEEEFNRIQQKRQARHQARQQRKNK